MADKKPDPGTTHDDDDHRALQDARLRTMRMIALWTFIFGAGIGFVIGYTVGLETAREAAELGYPRD